MIKGKISNRPKSMAPERTILERFVYAAKFPVGPTAPNPGPMLLKQAVTAEKLVSNPNGSKETIRKTATKQIK